MARKYVDQPQSTSRSARLARLRCGFLDRLGPLLILAVGACAYANSFQGVFLFDDVGHITRNPHLHDAFSLGDVLSSKRPVLELSLVINHAAGGFEPWGYHAVNLAVHLLAALTLQGLIRRTIERLRLEDDGGRVASSLALAAALLWAVHPLGTQSVTYIVQRSESMMVLFYLLTLYGVARGARSARGRVWYIAAVICCGLGMGSKAVMVTAPLLVLLYDRIFLAPSSAVLLRRRWGLYVGLFATWGILWVCGVAPGVLNPGNAAAHVGFGYQGATSWQYAMTQCGVLLRYLALSVWPGPLCLDYGWPVTKHASSIVPHAVIILALLTLSLATLFKRPAAGFAAVSFFVVLSPTSSIVPIRDALFEHRMYLPLACLLLMGVAGAGRALRWLVWRRPDRTHSCQLLGTLGLTVIVATLVVLTVRRNTVYSGERAMWRDVLAKRPANPRAHDAIGTSLQEQGLLADAVTAHRKAVRLDPTYAQYHFNLGTALLALGDAADAATAFREAIAIRPRDSLAHVNLGNALVASGRLDEAIEVYRSAVRLRSRNAAARVNLGNVLFRVDRLDEAIETFRNAIRVEPSHAGAHYNLGNALSKKGLEGEAVAAYRRAVALDPANASALVNLGHSLLRLNRFDDAIEAYESALKTRPDHPTAAKALDYARSVRSGKFPP